MSYQILNYEIYKKFYENGSMPKRLSKEEFEDFLKYLDENLFKVRRAAMSIKDIDDSVNCDDCLQIGDYLIDVNEDLVLYKIIDKYNLEDPKSITRNSSLQDMKIHMTDHRRSYQLIDVTPQSNALLVYLKNKNNVICVHLKLLGALPSAYWVNHFTHFLFLECNKPSNKFDRFKSHRYDKVKDNMLILQQSYILNAIKKEISKDESKHISSQDLICKISEIIERHSYV